MRHHYSDDVIEGFAMGRLQGPQLVDFEEHLLQCEECQDAVRLADQFLITVLGATKHLRQHEKFAPGFLVSTRPQNEYVLVESFLPNIGGQNIGVLRVDTEADRLTHRFRPDFEKFAGQSTDQSNQLPDAIEKKADELGAEKCLEWLGSRLSGTLRLSARKRIPLEEDGATSVDKLYSSLVRPHVIPFRTHLPQYSLEAAAGKFGKQAVVEPEGWVKVNTETPLTEEMFVTHVEGHSMEPLIPDASLCAFRANLIGSWDGKVLLLEHYGEAGGNRYTVKKCHASETVDPLQEGDEGWLHPRVTLESINPDYKPWEVGSAEKIRALGEFLFVVDGAAKPSVPPSH